MDPRGNAVEAEEDGDRSSQICKIYVNGIEIRPLRKRLIILDVNGLLADVVCPPPEDHMADVTIEGRAIFKRPFYLDFLNFCFENFEVGIWSSRREQFVGRDIDYLIPPFLKNKLVFCWDGSYCTEAWIYKQGKKSIVYSKDLRKLWQKGDPNLPWNKLYYNESNTLMLDVCPYRGILNPRTTTVYPLPFNYHDNDNSLAQGGELRAYLQGLTEVDDMRKYVKEHPFGQEAINNASINWIRHSRYILEYRKD
ncbi:uncharacterized protein LOC106766450 [Vigna radiata var. radiata]|uniref:Mitochondrial import inner membrane translocase subunit TIM50 n=1 Tax=Vigna radiata var. radiata TaxID=3916 RepID=A0A1S3UL39_VIGRR|nr:uncharacterized protein LOC106766450 [Vigna radiata var. radiata]